MREQMIIDSKLRKDRELNENKNAEILESNKY